MKGFIEVQLLAERVAVNWKLHSDHPWRTISIGDIKSFERAPEYSYGPVEGAPSEISLRDGSVIRINQSYPVLRELVKEAS